MIVLAAGPGNQVDGLAKSLIRHPSTGKTVIEHLKEAFSDRTITIVVGYRAIQIMERYPELNYVLNSQWSFTGSAFSLGLALTDEPTYIVSGDIFLEADLVERLDNLGPDLVLTEARENRNPNSVHCSLRKDGTLDSTYQGPVRNSVDPEAIGLLKVSNIDTLRVWKQLSLKHGNLHAVQLLPCRDSQIFSVERAGEMFDEVNSADDYLRLIESQFRLD